MLHTISQASREELKQNLSHSEFIYSSNILKKNNQSFGFNNAFVFKRDRPKEITIAYMICQIR